MNLHNCELNKLVGLFPKLTFSDISLQGHKADDYSVVEYEYTSQHCLGPLPGPKQGSMFKLVSSAQSPWVPCTF